ANEKTGNDVDCGDQDRGHSVALAEPRRAVHRTIELSFAGDEFPSGSSRTLVDDSGVEIGVNGHLLSGQSVERKARRHFRGSKSAVVDNKVLNGDEGEEYDEADHIIAADHKLAK